jgi:hypothetical protein
VIIDLENISGGDLLEYSEKLGGGKIEKTDDNGGWNWTFTEGNCQYGLVYYTNLGSHTKEQIEFLSVTSKKVFGAEVIYE